MVTTTVQTVKISKRLRKRIQKVAKRQKKTVNAFLTETIEGGVLAYEVELARNGKL